MTWCWPNGVTDPSRPPPMGDQYGPRPPIQTPDGWTGSFHTGVDFDYDFVTVRSVGPGTVIFVGDRGTGNGLEVVVDHGSWISRYYHLRSRKLDVQVGLVVDGGHPLGVMGNTGKAIGVHLHLRFDEQAYAGATAGAHFDPVPFLVNAMRAQGDIAGGGGTTPIPAADPAAFHSNRGGKTMFVYVRATNQNLFAIWAPEAANVLERWSEVTNDNRALPRRFVDGLHNAPFDPVTGKFMQASAVPLTDSEWQYYRNRALMLPLNTPLPN